MNKTQTTAEIMLKYAEIKLYSLQTLISNQIKLLKAQLELEQSADSDKNEWQNKVTEIMEEVAAADEQYLNSQQTYDQAANDYNFACAEVRD